MAIVNGFNNAFGNVASKISKALNNSNQQIKAVTAPRIESALAKNKVKSKDDIPEWRAANQENKAKDINGDQINEDEKLQIFDENGNPISVAAMNDSGPTDKYIKEPYNSDSIFANVLNSFKNSDQYYDAQANEMRRLYDSTSRRGTMGSNGDENAGKVSDGFDENGNLLNDEGEIVDDAYSSDMYNWMMNNGINYQNGIAGFAADGTYDEWKKLLQDESMAKYYQDAINQFGTDGVMDDDAFKRYWDYYKPKQLEDIYGDRAMMLDSFGTSAGALSDMSDYLVNNGMAYDIGNDERWVSNGEEDDSLKNLFMYEMGDLISQALIDKGIIGDAYLQHFSPNELNNIFAIDDMMFGLEGMEDDMGTIGSTGKTNNPIHSTEFNWNALNEFGVPYAGLADTLWKAADDKLHYTSKKALLEKQQQQQQESGE